MIGPLNLPSRMAMIIAIAFTTVWLGAIGISFLSNDSVGRQNWPSADRLGAIVTLMENTPDNQRSPAIIALTSNAFIVSLHKGPLKTTKPGLEPFVTLVNETYAHALAGRAFSITAAQPSDVVWKLIHTHRVGKKVLGLQIQLTTGDIVAIDVTNAPGITTLGLPIGLLAGLFGTLVALGALVSMHRELRPLSRLARAVDRVDITSKFVALPRPRGGASEIVALIDAFDRLKERLAQLMQARMAMLGGISHDVRTFATRLRLRVELIPEGRERDRAIGDISDIIRLLDDALLASRAGVGELAEELLQFDILVLAEVEDRQAAGAAIYLYVEPGALAATILGDHLALRRVVANLVDNALKYGKVAHLNLRVEAKLLKLTVDDNGPGIPTFMREILLEPFVRLETSRNRDTGGSGLGLAIVRNLVEAHNGSVSIADAPSGGGRVLISLPIFVPT